MKNTSNNYGFYKNNLNDTFNISVIDSINENNLDNINSSNGNIDDIECKNIVIKTGLRLEPAAGLNKLLVSDALGNASWSTLNVTDWTDTTEDLKTTGDIRGRDLVMTRDIYGKSLLAYVNVDNSATNCNLRFGNTSNGFYSDVLNTINLSTNGFVKYRFRHYSLNAANSNHTCHDLYGRVAVSDTYTPNMTDSYHLSVESAAPPFSSYRKTESTSSANIIVQSNVGSTKNIRFAVLNSGDVVNVNNAYGALSDDRLKNQIEDSRDYTDDIMKLKLKKYKMGDVNNLGFLANEIEAVFPSLITINNEIKRKDKDNNEITNVKSVKYSILYLMGLQCIQKLKTRCDKLENDVIFLDNKVSTLETKITNIEKSLENTLNKP